MANKLVRLVTKQYIPGTPAVPPKPARCYTVPVSASRTGSVGGAQSTFIPVSEIEGNTGISYSGFLTPVYRTVIVNGVPQQEIIGYNALRFGPAQASLPSFSSPEQTICEPAVPGVEGVPAQVLEQNAGPDWRASARSVEIRSGDVTASFDVNTKPRMIVGFATRDTGSNQSDIKMGVAFASAGAATQVLPVINGVQQASVANFSSGDRVSLTRAQGRFFIQLGSTTVYTGAAPTEDDVFLDAMLYTSNDFVDDPAFSDPTTTPVSGSVGFAMGILNSGIVMNVSFTQVMRTGVYYVGVNPPADVGTDLSGASVAVGPLSVFAADRPYGAVSTTLSPLMVEAAGGLVTQSVQGADLVINGLQAYGTMLTGGTATVAVELQSFKMFAADRVYAQGIVSLKSLRVYADDGFGVPGYYGHNEVLNMTADIYPDPSIFASIYGELELEPTMSLGTLVSGTVMEGLLLDPSLSAADFLNALIESGITLTSATQIPDPTVAQYAFNALTGAATRYNGFDFTQFTRVGGVTYAIKPDGLYRLRPGDDGGELRSALVDFGAMSFGVQQRKHIETMYLGLSTDGTVYAKLQADTGDEKVYRVIQREPTMRVRTGRGITAREWSLKLEVVDASRVDLDNVEFVVGASVRRWTR